VSWDETIDSVDELLTRLDDRFGSAERQSYYLSELGQRKQKESESISDFYSDVKRLSALAFSGKLSPHANMVSVQSFISGLFDRSLARDVMIAMPTDVDAAYKLAQRFNSFKEVERSKERGNWRRDGRVQMVKEGESSSSSLLKRLEKVEKAQQKSKSDDVRMTKPQFYGASMGCQPPPFMQPQYVPPSAVNNLPPQHSFTAQAPPTAFNGPMDVRRCHYCNEPDHVIRYCPYRQETEVKHDIVYGNNREESSMAANGGVVYSRQVKGSSSAYIKMQLHGKTVPALLDSGCGSNICPVRYIRAKNLQPSNQVLFAANESQIQVLGESVLRARIGGRHYQIPVLVTNQVSDIVIGLAFLEDNDFVWRFRQRCVEFNGQRVPLHYRPDGGKCRRMVATDDVDIPPYSEHHVGAYAVLPDLVPNKSSWATKPVVLDTGLFVAGTLQPNRITDLVMRVMNPTNRTIRLTKGIKCDLEEVAVKDASAEDVLRSDCCTVRQMDAPDAEAVIAPMWTNIADDVPAEIQEKLKSLLLEHKSAFSLGEWDLGYTDILQHRIDTGDEVPVRQPLRRHPMVWLPLIDEQVEMMLGQNLIEPSHGDWSSNVVMVTKRDGSPRFCLDFRLLNSRTRRDVFPLPLISECLDVLGGSQWFSCFDLTSSYHQMALHPDDRHKTTFLTRKGAWQFRVLPQGLCGSPASFSRLMSLIMAGLNFSICLIYLDDIIVFSSDLDTHLERLALVLRRLDAANLKLKPSKCHLLQKEVNFLGHLVSGAGIAADPSKVEAVKSWPTPTKLREVRAFLGLCSYYRKFVPDFAKIARPLHALTKKEVKFEWTPECADAFERLKTCLTEAPVLALPSDDGVYILDADASGTTIGGILSPDTRWCRTSHLLWKPDMQSS